MLPVNERVTLTATRSLARIACPTDDRSPAKPKDQGAAALDEGPGEALDKAGAGDGAVSAFGSMP